MSDLTRLAQLRALYHIPAEAFTHELTVRSYEADASGLVTTGTLLRYFEDVATGASASRGFTAQWYATMGTAWVVRDLRIIFGRLPEIGQPLSLATWISTTGMVQANREYVALRRDTGQLVARAQARWAYVDCYTGQPMRISPEITERLPILGKALTGFQEVPSVGGERSTMEVTARGYEADVQQHTNNAVYADWLSEGARLACARGAWGSQLLRPRQAHFTYLSPILTGESVTVTTELALQGKNCLFTHQAIYRVGSEAETMRGQMVYRVIGA